MGTRDKLRAHNRSLTVQARRGKWIERFPYGFRIEEDGHLVEDEEEMKNIIKMKRAYCCGESIRKIATRLESRNRLFTSSLRPICECLDPFAMRKWRPGADEKSEN